MRAREFRNFIIVGTQRTGSSALAAGLATHPDISCGWEWTQNLFPLVTIKIAEEALRGDFSRLKVAHRERMAEWAKSNARLLGFRRLFRSSNRWVFHPRLAPALWIDRLKGHIDWLETRPDIRIIHIVRRNNVDWVKSKTISKETGQYVGKTYRADAVAKIGIRKAIKQVLSKEWVDRQLTILSTSNPYMRVEYEQFLVNNLAVIDQVLEFLDCDPRKVPKQIAKIPIQPQSKKRPDQLLANYYQVEEALLKRGLAISKA